jgi:hypothetical protein
MADHGYVRRRVSRDDCAGIIESATEGSRRRFLQHRMRDLRGEEGSD